MLNKRINNAFSLYCLCKVLRILIPPFALSICCCLSASVVGWFSDVVDAFLFAHLGANRPRTQINDVKTSTYSPDWTTTAGKLVITPVVYANQTAIALNNNALTITWKRQEGSGFETALATGETISGNILTVSQNQLASITSGLLCGLCRSGYWADHQRYSGHFARPDQNWAEREECLNKRREGVQVTSLTPAK